MTDAQVNYTINMIADLDALVNYAVKRSAELRTRLQDNCEHLHIALAPYQPEGIVTYAEPPFAVCLTCGYAEEHWGCGPIALKPGARDVTVERMSRAEAMAVAGRTRLLTNSEAIERARRLGKHGW